MPLFSQKIYTHKFSKASHLWLLLATFLSAFSIAATAQAATYYVATTGSDSNAGSESAPFKTIAHAVNRMNAGDTTYVKGGTYNEKEILFKRSGTASAPIKLMNAPGETPIVDFGVTESNKDVHRFNLDAPGIGPISWITIEGFDIRNGYDGIKYMNASDITIRRNWIHGGPGQGILGRGINITIDRNVISHTGSDHFDHGMYLTGSNYVITNNLVYANATHGIQVAGYLWKGSTHYKPVEGGAPDIRYAGASNFLIANNTLAYNGSSAIVIWQSEAENNRVVNNIFYENGVTSKSGNNGSNGVNFLNSGRGNKIDNNMFYTSGGGGTQDITNGTEGVHYTQSGNITANPNFEGAGATLSGVPNFKLLAGSPAIDKVQTPATTWDHAGGARPHGGSPDIGAYEFGSPPDSGSPPPNPTDVGGGWGAGGGGGTGGGLGSCYK